MAANGVYFEIDGVHYLIPVHPDNLKAGSSKVADDKDTEVIEKATEVIDEDTQVMVSNLDINVDGHDLAKVFKEFGQLRKVSVYCDKRGQSLGMAQLLFGRYYDALDAVTKYNNLHLDGRPMELRILCDNGPPLNKKSSLLAKGVRSKKRKVIEDEPNSKSKEYDKSIKKIKHSSIDEQVNL